MMSESEYPTEAEAEDGTISERSSVVHQMVNHITAICEQSLQAAIHSTGLLPEERVRLMSVYRKNVSQSLQALGREES